MGHAELLVQVADVRLDGGSRHVQLTGDLVVAVAGIDQPQHLPFALGERAGADQLRHLRVGQQLIDEVLVKMRELVPMMLVDVAQNALGTMLFQLRQRVELDQLAQLLRHRFALDDNG